MRNKFILALALIVTACAPKPDPNIQIQVAVASTLSAIPTNTSQPIPTPYPSPTAFSLAGLFCEYQFCIGHPLDMAFYDVSAQQNPVSPSSYSQGLLAAFNGNLFIQMIWQLAPGAADPQFLLDLILEEGLDTRFGNPDVKLIRDMNVVYTPITSTASPLLSNGAAAAWNCGDRVFAWKVYSPQADNAQALFDMAMERFQCNH
ncbi:MAG: hypothetical protein IPM31_12055 [Anaerolineae bacterium]|nr:hypothetical protein [Anaerolineae bacterium]MBL8106772.1 hypothetical protein [Anaerolineales bacterium]MCC7190118.1 hypothetical protein [Anaerolineales bacterium]